MRHWTIPRQLWQQSLEEVGAFGREGREGICLWLARQDSGSNLAFVRSAVLRGPLIRRGPLSIQIDSMLIDRFTDVVDREGLLLAGQIHGHPERFTDLSDVDRAMGFRVPKFLSVVAPYYGTHANTAFRDCGFHEFVAGSDYRRLPEHELALRVTLSETPVAAPLSV
jgi:hypothetical protein